MKPLKKIIYFLSIVSLLITSSSAYPYGYGTAGEDPLIIMFKKVISELKKPEKNWDDIGKIVVEIKAPIASMEAFFKLKIYSKFEKSVSDKDAKSLVNNTVNLIYLSMMEKFELIKQNEFKDYDFAKGRLALNDKYYKEIFKGNVIKYDSENGTSYNDAILKALQDIQGTIGKPAKFGIGGEPPHIDDYNKMYNEIKSNLKKAFPFLEG